MNIGSVSRVTTNTSRGSLSLIKSYLFSTVAIGASASIGDFVCQFLERNRTQSIISSSDRFSRLPWWDYQRTAIMCTSAVFVSTPYQFAIAQTIERLFPGRESKQIMKKMLCNTAMAPLGISLVFTSITLLKGQSLSQAKEKVEKDMPSTFVTGTCYWPFVSFINFRYFPLDYRPFFSSVAGTIWNIYMSSVANKKN